MKPKWATFGKLKVRGIEEDVIQVVECIQNGNTEIWRTSIIEQGKPVSLSIEGIPGAENVKAWWQSAGKGAASHILNLADAQLEWYLEER